MGVQKFQLSLNFRRFFSYNLSAIADSTILVVPMRKNQNDWGGVSGYRGRLILQITVLSY